MPQTPSGSVENNFTAGLKTEFTGMNFPENAATDTDNCIYTLIGDVLRRDGFDYEANYLLSNLSGTSGSAISTYRWLNVGGDGSTQILVVQIGSTLYFFRSSSATIASPISTTKLASTITLTAVSGDPSGTECQYADGNGFLFVFHPQCDPIYCTYNAGTVTGNTIIVQIRDTLGIPETGIAFNYRPTVLSAEHQYNLANQGWGSAWSTASTTSNTIGTGSFSWVVTSATLPINIGDTVTAIPNVFDASSGKYVPSPGIFITGTVSAYSGLVLTITETANGGAGTYGTNGWVISPSPNYINTFYTTAKTGTSGGSGGNALNRFPSNAEQWWWYRSTNVTAAAPDGVFKPSITTDYVVLSNNQAPQGSIILSAFNQNRSAVSLISGLTAVTTNSRPRTGCWFQGRVWYSGVDDTQAATGDAPFYTWSETIYFSQIITQPSWFGYCYQQNDPTSDRLFDLLPTDGGTIVIQGSGPIYKLFPIQNGLLVFAANGIWFITGSQGIGFAANDYTITKISNIESISGNTFVNVLGYPFFWNQEGIYEVSPSQQGGGLQVTPITLGTILSFYDEIPFSNRRYARGSYDPLNYTIQWLFRSTEPSTTLNKFQYDRALSYNISNKAFYPYTFSGFSANTLCSIDFIQSPGGATADTAKFKYLVYNGTNFTFAEENAPDYVDWHSSGTDYDFTSYFVTGTKLHGKALRRFQSPYVIFYSNINEYEYLTQGLWNYATSGNSGKWTQTQLVSKTDTNYNKLFNRLRFRGRGNVLQLKVTSVSGQPFDIMGWAMYEQVNNTV